VVIASAQIPRFGLAVPQRIGDDPASVIEALGRMGELEHAHPQLGALWCADYPIGGAGLVAPLALLSFLAARTERVLLGSAVLVAPMHNPAELAQTAGSVDQVSGGRLVLGLGAGNAELRRSGGGGSAAWGSWYSKLVTATISLLRGRAVTSVGPSWDLQDATVSPLPRQPHLPVWLSGHARNAIDRAARLADGWIGSGFVTTEGFADDVKLLRDACTQHGRGVETMVVAKRAYVHVPGACSQGRQSLDEWCERMPGGPERARSIVVSGSVESCAEQLVRITNAGADHLILDPVYNEPGHIAVILDDVVSWVSDQLEPQAGSR
jgi:alkanesulfonate monooxygenase SsuD/methylene tetrahydromethanopterin reductase-like flavin-dependent oxidoreductase (luciferase family)